MDLLKGKKILLFSQFFFGYEKKIAEKMREFGAEVSLYDEMSVTKPIERALLKVSANIFKRKTEHYYFDILEKEKNNLYDYVLFIDCEMPSVKILEEYRTVFTNAKFCLHLWDSLKNLKGVKDKFSCFDYISSFDRKDAEECGIAFRPLFFIDAYRANSISLEYEYNLSFIGTIHSDRYAIIKKLLLSTEKSFVYPFLQSKFIYYFYRLTKPEFKGTSINDFKFSKIESKTIAEVISKSKAVLDIQHPKQTGLTMRTLEMLGMKKKFVTTNSDIVNYDFYNNNNICVIDRLNPAIPEEFYSTKYEDVPEQIYEFYSINQWVLGVLGIK